MKNYRLKNGLVEILIIQWVHVIQPDIRISRVLIAIQKLNDIINPDRQGLYYGDGLIIIDNCTPRKGDIIRKKLHWLFDKFEFKLDIQANLKIIDYLDVTFNLYDETLCPFRKKTNIIHAT